jgi:hypothetical protein
MSENDAIGRDPDTTATNASGTTDESTPSNGDGVSPDDGTPKREALRTDDGTGTAESSDEPAELLQARLELLREENDRLRREYTRSRRSQYRRTALWLGVLGVLGVGGALLVPQQSAILFALGGTGLFGGVLTYYLTPERFVPATVGERVHQAHTANQAALIDDLGLQDERLYVPTPEQPTPARLFVPQRVDHEIPASDALDHLLVVTTDPATRGVAFTPTGAPLYEEFEATVTGDPASEPGLVATQLADAIVETFELAASAAADADRGGDAVAIRVSDPVFGTLDDPDHPVVSVLATGLAVRLGRPVSVTVRETEDAAGIVGCEFADTEQ